MVPGLHEDLESRVTELSVEVVRVRLSWVVTVACILLLTAPTTADALTVSSSWGYIGETNGVRYRNQANVSNDSQLSRAYGGTTLESRDGQVSTGWMGARGRVYRNGALCADEGSYYYNPSPSIRISTSAHGDCGFGEYKSRGLTREWTGNGYNTHYTFWTAGIAA